MRHWTPEERAKQSELIRRHKPWEKSTGPTTPEGKAAACRNGTTHGYYSQEMRDLKAALLQARKLLALARTIAPD
jgi:hypothetical protein